MSLPWRRTPTREDYLLENFTSKFLLFTLIWLESSDLNLCSTNRFEIWKQNKKFKYSRAPSKQLGVWRGLVRHVSFRQDYPKTKTPKATKIHFLLFWANLNTTEHYKPINVTGNLPNSQTQDSRLYFSLLRFPVPCISNPHWSLAFLNVFLRHAQLDKVISNSINKWPLIFCLPNWENCTWTSPRRSLAPDEKTGKFLTTEN